MVATKAANDPAEEPVDYAEVGGIRYYVRVIGLCRDLGSNPEETEPELLLAAKIEGFKESRWNRKNKKK